MTARLHLVESATAATEVGPDRLLLLDSPAHYPLHGTEMVVGPAMDDLAAHLERYGERPVATGAAGEEFLRILDGVGLTGRGGAHFPAAIKWRSALEAGGGGMVVANGAEGEPASAKDAALLQHRPHLVLDGLVIAAETIGADDLVVWLHRGAHATHRSVSRAIAERRAAGLREPHIRIAEGPDHYLSGESSAVIRALSGGPALPRLARKPSTIDGVGGRPTLLHNVETLARVGQLARTGSIGVVPSQLVTVINEGERVVREVGADVTFADLLGPQVPSAVLIGGYGGAWVPWSRLADVMVHEDDVKQATGASLGAGVIATLPADACGLRATATLLRYLAGSSARQCGPCAFGLPALSDLCESLADGRASASDVALLHRYAGEIDGRGACHHPDGAVRLLRSALATFADDVVAHVDQRPCSGRSVPAALPVPEAN